MNIKQENELVNLLYDIWDQFVDVAEIAVNNYIAGFCDGVVFLDLETGELYGSSMTQGTIKNPDEPAVEIYRLSKNFDPSDVCTGCAGCTLLENETEEDVFQECFIETVGEDFRCGFTTRNILNIIDEAGKYI